jgi:hypothetical protein
MRGLWAVVVAFIVVAAAVPIYFVLIQPPSSSPCGPNSGGSPPLVVVLGAPPFGLEYMNTTRVGSMFWYNFSVIPVPTNLVVSQLTLRVLLPNESAAIGVDQYLVWNGAGHIVAIANGSTSAWTEGSSSSLQFADTVTVVSSTSLVGYYLEGTVPIGCGQTASSLSPFG